MQIVGPLPAPILTQQAGDGPRNLKHSPSDPCSHRAQDQTAQAQENTLCVSCAPRPTVTCMGKLRENFKI